MISYININNFYNDNSLIYTNVEKIESIQQLEDVEQVENQMRSILSKQFSSKKNHVESKISNVLASLGSIRLTNGERESTGSMRISSKSIQMTCAEPIHPGQLFNQIVQRK